jgi:gluconolactonase
MKTKALFVILILAFSSLLIAQQRGGNQQQNFDQPTGARQVTVTAIPGVVAAGAQWKLAWGGSNNADGIVGTSDGGVMFAQEQPSTVGKLDANDRYTILVRDTHGAGSLSMDAMGRIVAVLRTCTDPGNAGRGITAPCTEPTAVAFLTPQFKIITNAVDGKSFGRPNDLVTAKNGNIYFNSGGTYRVDPAGKTTLIGPTLRTNGIMLSPDEKTLYVTNGPVVVAFDVNADGSVKNLRDFGKLEMGGNGDGMAVDSTGRLYVTTQARGVQVFSPEGKHLGIIPTPRDVASIAFSGPDKKMLYVTSSGALIDGKEFQTPAGVRNNAKSIFKLPVLAQGFMGRAK